MKKIWIFVIAVSSQKFALPPGRYDSDCVLSAQIDHLILPAMTKAYKIPEGDVQKYSEQYRSKFNKSGHVTKQSEALLYLAQTSDPKSESMKEFIDKVLATCISFDEGELMFVPETSTDNLAHPEGSVQNQVAKINPTLLQLFPANKKALEGFSSPIEEKKRNYIHSVPKIAESDSIGQLLRLGLGLEDYHLETEEKKQPEKLQPIRIPIIIESKKYSETNVNENGETEPAEITDINIFGNKKYKKGRGPSSFLAHENQLSATARAGQLFGNSLESFQSLQGISNEKPLGNAFGVEKDCEITEGVLTFLMPFRTQPAKKDCLGLIGNLAY
eukprot:GHVP01059380.1.p2 GENE.GHVP01059380.1~~GHVP01059380.1.p2  ORF type:complete len:330 (-),score=74.65 GHVP01059380.1:26-1015(-)